MKSFKQLLLKKAAGNSILKDLVKVIVPSELADLVNDRLEKMAKPGGNAGIDSPKTPAVGHYAGIVMHKPGPGQPYKANTVAMHQIREALGHHASEYKALMHEMNVTKDPALLQDVPEHLRPAYSAALDANRATMRQHANEHLEKYWHTAHLAQKLHDGNAFAMSYAEPRAWELNVIGSARDANGKRTPDPKGWGFRPKGDRQKVLRDFQMMVEHGPHHDHEKTHKDDITSAHKGKRYPLEAMQIGSRADVDSNRAYIPIDNNRGVTYKPRYDTSKSPITFGGSDEEYNAMTPEQKLDLHREHAVFSPPPGYDEGAYNKLSEQDKRMLHDLTEHVPVYMEHPYDNHPVFEDIRDLHASHGYAHDAQKVAKKEADINAWSANVHPEMLRDNEGNVLSHPHYDAMKKMPGYKERLKALMAGQPSPKGDHVHGDAVGEHSPDSKRYAEGVTPTTFRPTSATKGAKRSKKDQENEAELIRRGEQLIARHRDRMQQQPQQPAPAAPPLDTSAKPENISQEDWDTMSDDDKASWHVANMAYNQPEPEPEFDISQFPKGFPEDQRELYFNSTPQEQYQAHVRARDYERYMQAEQERKKALAFGQKSILRPQSKGYPPGMPTHLRPLYDKTTEGSKERQLFHDAYPGDGSGE